MYYVCPRCKVVYEETVPVCPCNTGTFRAVKERLPRLHEAGYTLTRMLSVDPGDSIKPFKELLGSSSIEGLVLSDGGSEERPGVAAVILRNGVRWWLTAGSGRAVFYAATVPGSH